MKAMESSKNFPMMGKVEVDESDVGGQDDKALGRNGGKRKSWWVQKMVWVGFLWVGNIYRNYLKGQYWEYL